MGAESEEEGGGARNGSHASGVLSGAAYNNGQGKGCEALRWGEGLGGVGGGHALGGACRWLEEVWEDDWAAESPCAANTLTNLSCYCN